VSKLRLFLTYKLHIL